MRHALSAGMAIALVASPAIASQWKLLSAGHDDAGRYIIFGDKTSIKAPAKRVRQIWIEMVREKPSKLGDVSTKQLDEIDCDHDRVRAMSIYASSESGELLYSANRPGEWQSIPPDSFGEAELHAACVGFPDSSFTMDDPLVEGRKLLRGEDPLPKVAR